MHLPSLFQFLTGLHENNNRPWFLHNKAQYDILREEWIALIAEVGKRVARFDPQIVPFDAAKSVYRIYRDMRFSKDKTPYKSHFAAVIGVRQQAGKSAPMHYLQINHSGRLLIASGIYAPDKLTLQKIRDHIVAHPQALGKLLKNKPFVASFGDISDDGRMSRLPKGYAADSPHADYLRNRNFFCETTANITSRTPKDLPAAIAGYFEAAMPLSVWLRGAVVDAKP